MVCSKQTANKTHILIAIGWGFYFSLVFCVFWEFFCFVFNKSKEEKAASLLGRASLGRRWGSLEHRILLCASLPLPLHAFPSGPWPSLPRPGLSPCTSPSRGMTQPAMYRSCASVSPPCSPSLWALKSRWVSGRCLIGSRCIGLHMTSLTASYKRFLLSVFFPLGTFFPLKFGGKCWKLYFFNIFQHIFKVIRTNFCPVVYTCLWKPAKGKKKGRGKSRGKKQKKPEVDILSPAAMLNLYYIAHNVADCLQLRGFRWPGAAKTKKGKGKT